MNPKWIVLAARFLDEAADHYGNHGCNDWEWPKDWTDDEKRELIRQMFQEDGTPEDFDPEHLNEPDYRVMMFLARQLLILPSQQRKT